MRPLLLLLFVAFLATDGSAQENGEGHEPRNSLSSFAPTVENVSVYGALIASAEIRDRHSIDCSISYYATVTETIRSQEEAKNVRFCSGHSLYAGRKYLIAIKLGGQGEESNSRAPLTELHESKPNVLLPYWFFEVYDVHLDDGSAKEVVKIPAPTLHVPRQLLHSQLVISSGEKGDDHEYSTVYNIVDWKGLVGAMKRNLSADKQEDGNRID